MSDVTNRFIWVFTVAVLASIGAALGGYWLCRMIPLWRAKSDLYSGEPSRMGPAFAYLARRGPAGLEIIEEYCRSKTDTDWGKAVGGIRAKISTRSYLLGERKSVTGNLNIEGPSKNTIKHPE